MRLFRGKSGRDPDAEGDGLTARQRRRKAAAVQNGRVEIQAALLLDDHRDQMLGVVSAVQTALSDLRLRPVIVGGSAVEYWTDAYTSYDIDVLLPTTDEIHDRLAALGFEPRADGRHWALPGSQVLWEMPGSDLAPDDGAVDVPAPSGERVLVLRCEDILVHRLEEFVATGHRDVAQQALALIIRPDLDRRRLFERARASHVEDAVAAFFELAEDVESGTLETWDLHELSQRLLASQRRRSTMDPDRAEDDQQERS